MSQEICSQEKKFKASDDLFFFNNLPKQSKRRSSILRTIDANTNNDERRASRRVSFANNLFCQELKPDGTTQLITEPFKEPSNDDSENYNFTSTNDIIPVIRNDKRRKSTKSLRSYLSSHYNMQDANDYTTVLNTSVNRTNAKRKFDLDGQKKDLNTLFCDEDMELTNIEKENSYVLSKNDNKFKFENLNNTKLNYINSQSNSTKYFSTSNNMDLTNMTRFNETNLTNNTKIFGNSNSMDITNLNEKSLHDMSNCTKLFSSNSMDLTDVDKENEFFNTRNSQVFFTSKMDLTNLNKENDPNFMCSSKLHFTNDGLNITNNENSTLINFQKSNFSNSNQENSSTFPIKNSELDKINKTSNNVYYNISNNNDMDLTLLCDDDMDLTNLSNNENQSNILKKNNTAPLISLSSSSDNKNKSSKFQNSTKIYFSSNTMDLTDLKSEKSSKVDSENVSQVSINSNSNKNSNETLKDKSKQKFSTSDMDLTDLIDLNKSSKVIDNTANASLTEQENKTFNFFSKKTEHFTSQPMELTNINKTVQSNTSPDDSMTLSDMDITDLSRKDDSIDKNKEISLINQSKNLNFIFSSKETQENDQTNLFSTSNMDLTNLKDDSFVTNKSSNISMPNLELTKGLVSSEKTMSSPSKNYTNDKSIRKSFNFIKNGISNSIKILKDNENSENSFSSDYPSPKISTTSLKPHTISRRHTNANPWALKKDKLHSTLNFRNQSYFAQKNLDSVNSESFSKKSKTTEIPSDKIGKKNIRDFLVDFSPKNSYHFKNNISENLKTINQDIAVKECLTDSEKNAHKDEVEKEKISVDPKVEVEKDNTKIISDSQEIVSMKESVIDSVEISEKNMFKDEITNNLIKKNEDLTQKVSIGQIIEGNKELQIDDTKIDLLDKQKAEIEISPKKINTDVDFTQELLVDEKPNVLKDITQELLVDEKTNTVENNIQEILVEEGNSSVKDINQEISIDEKINSVRDITQEILVDENTIGIKNITQEILVDGKSSVLKDITQELFVDEKNNFVKDNIQEILVDEKNSSVKDINQEISIDEVTDPVKNITQEIFVDQPLEFVKDCTTEYLADQKAEVEKCFFKDLTHKTLISENTNEVKNSAPEILVNEKNTSVLNISQKATIDLPLEIVKEHTVEHLEGKMLETSYKPLVELVVDQEMEVDKQSNLKFLTDQKADIEKNVSKNFDEELLIGQKTEILRELSNENLGFGKELSEKISKDSSKQNIIHLKTESIDDNKIISSNKNKILENSPFDFLEIPVKDDLINLKEKSFEKINSNDLNEKTLENLKSNISEENLINFDVSITEKNTSVKPSEEFLKINNTTFETLSPVVKKNSTYVAFKLNDELIQPSISEKILSKNNQSTFIVNQKENFDFFDKSNKNNTYLIEGQDKNQKVEKDATYLVKDTTGINNSVLENLNEILFNVENKKSFLIQNSKTEDISKSLDTNKSLSIKKNNLEIGNLLIPEFFSSESKNNSKPIIFSEIDQSINVSNECKNQILENSNFKSLLIPLKENSVEFKKNSFEEENFENQVVSKENYKANNSNENLINFDISSKEDSPVKQNKDISVFKNSYTPVVSKNESKNSTFTRLSLDNESVCRNSSQNILSVNNQETFVDDVKNNFDLSNNFNKRNTFLFKDQGENDNSYRNKSDFVQEINNSVSENLNEVSSNIDNKKSFLNTTYEKILKVEVSKDLSIKEDIPVTEYLSVSKNSFQNFENKTMNETTPMEIDQRDLESMEVDNYDQTQESIFKKDLSVLEKEMGRETMNDSIFAFQTQTNYTSSVNTTDHQKESLEEKIKVANEIMFEKSLFTDFLVDAEMFESEKLKDFFVKHNSDKINLKAFNGYINLILDLENVTEDKFSTIKDMHLEINFDKPKLIFWPDKFYKFYLDKPEHKNFILILKEIIQKQFNKAKELYLEKYNSTEYSINIKNDLEILLNKIADLAKDIKITMLKFNNHEFKLKQDETFDFSVTLFGINKKFVVVLNIDPYYYPISIKPRFSCWLEEKSIYPFDEIKSIVESVNKNDKFIIDQTIIKVNKFIRTIRHDYHKKNILRLFGFLS